MKTRKAAVACILAGFGLAGLSGCESTEIPLEKAAPVDIPAPKPLPTDAKKGGGKGSSGNMNRNPGAST